MTNRILIAGFSLIASILMYQSSLSRGNDLMANLWGALMCVWFLVLMLHFIRVVREDE